MAFGVTNPIPGASIDVWGAGVNDVLNAGDEYVTKTQASMVIPLSKGDDTYLLVVSNRIPSLIEEVNYSTDVGTLTISNITIGVSPITGFSALSATTTGQDATASAANVYASGNLSVAVAGIAAGATELRLNFSVLQTAARS